MKKFLIDFMMYCFFYGVIVFVWMMFGFYVYFCGYVIYSNLGNVFVFS